MALLRGYADDAPIDRGLQWAELPREALFLAARAHRLYRRRGGTWAMVPPDFFIAAHAAISALPLLSCDRRRYGGYFNGLEVVAPAGRG